ncbi:MAG: hypothetical protein CMB80_15695 [Flammeovirgaceae bacterium]|nr:hypothetical protein [Flammeovirgaceae bacterium]MBE61372.1 hypothetical protein [Flammeovirgaceae bacterium]MBR09494.1 hypothetical protein [Rickettsiales bacterium]HCX22721.1 hypothetical protein [Cytophagales bacterium]
MEFLTNEEHEAINRIYEESLAWLVDATRLRDISTVSKLRDQKLLELLGPKRFREFKAEVKSS